MVELNCLPKLRELYLWNGADHIELVQSSSLTSLRLCGASGIESSLIVQLKGVPNIRQLSLQLCDLADLSGLSAMTHLEVLDVTSNHFMEDSIMLNANSLRGLTMLRALHLASSDVCKPGVDLSPLKAAGVQIVLDKPTWGKPKLG